MLFYVFQPIAKSPTCICGVFSQICGLLAEKKDATSSTDRLFLNLTRIHKRIQTPYSFCSLLNSYWSMYIPVEKLTVYFFLINAFRLHGLLKNYTVEVNICKLYIQYILFLFCKGFMMRGSESRSNKVAPPLLIDEYLTNEKNVFMMP